MVRIRVYVQQRKDRTGFWLTYRDPDSRKKFRKKARHADRDEDIATRKEALKAAGVWEDELNSGARPSAATGWDIFLKRFRDEYLPSRSKGTAAVYSTSLRKFAELLGPLSLDRINASKISQFQSKLRAEGIADATIVSYLKHCRLAFRWSKRMNLMRDAPWIELPRIVESNLAGGRPLKVDEYKRMLATCGKVHAADPGCAESLRRLISGLWLSGMRIGEAFRISWTDPPIRLDLDSGRYPRIIWHAVGHKARRDDRTPITPDFYNFLKRTPLKQRVGPVFPVCLCGVPISQDRTMRLVSEIGTAAGIRVGDSFATAQDLRRSFGTRWAQKVMPVTLKALMRHKDIKTTLRYYVDLESDDVAAELWPAARGAPNGAPKGGLKRPGKQTGTQESA